MNTKFAILQIINDSISDLVFYKDLNGRFIGCNPAFEKFAGCSEQELIGKDDLEVFKIDKEMAVKFMEADQRIMSGEGHEEKISEKIIYPDGHAEHVETVKTPLIVDGKIKGIIGIARNITDYHEKEKIQKEHIQYSKLLLDSNPIACIVFNSKGEIINCNEAALKFFSLGSKEILSHSVHNFQPANQPSGGNSLELLKKYLSLSQINDSVVFQWSFIKNNNLLPCEVTLRRINFQESDQVLAYIRDLRAEKAYISKIEEEITASRIMLDSMPIACLLVNSRREIYSCNKEALNLFEVPSEKEFVRVANNITAYLNPQRKESLDALKAIFSEAERKGIVNQEWQYTKKNGKTFCSQVTAVRVGEGQKQNIVCYIRDITEEKRMLQIYGDASKRNQIMLESIPLACGSFDSQLLLVSCNEEFLKLFGVADMLGFNFNFNNLMPEHQPNGLNSEARIGEYIQMVHEKGFLKYEWVFQNTDGDQIPCEVTWISYSLGSNEKTIICYIDDLRDLRENTERLSNLEKLASTDALTDTYNRRYFLEYINDYISKQGDYQLPYSILILDLDFFKKINDTYGHSVGDEVLKAIAKRVKEIISPEVIFARYGGEEFILFIPSLTAPKAYQLSEKIRKAVEKLEINIENRLVLKITISGGVADNQGLYRDLKYIIESADMALYEAKNSGRNKIEIFK